MYTVAAAEAVHGKEAWYLTAADNPATPGSALVHDAVLPCSSDCSAGSSTGCNRLCSTGCVLLARTELASCSSCRSCSAWPGCAWLPKKRSPASHANAACSCCRCSRSGMLGSRAAIVAAAREAATCHSAAAWLAPALLLLSSATAAARSCLAANLSCSRRAERLAMRVGGAAATALASTVPAAM